VRYGLTTPDMHPLSEKRQYDCRVLSLEACGNKHLFAHRCMKVRSRRAKMVQGLRCPVQLLDRLRERAERTLDSLTLYITEQKATVATRLHRSLLESTGSDDGSTPK
jgi:c-di-GMP-binding flagellar brake protein YcgR